MLILRKLILLATIISINIGSSQSQCWGFFFDSDKWNINAGVNSSLLTSVEFGKDWELEYGAGLKFRINWWDKKEDRNSYLIVNYNYITDYLVKESTDLHHNNIITSVDQIYSPDAMWRNYFELGYS